MKLNRYLSYIKDIYVELHDYSFIHSPSQGSHTSKRFIGRKRLKQRIKDLLVKGETRSGAYLITGFRGMGKSSLINQVLDELSPTFSDDRIRNRVLRIMIFTMLLGLLWYENIFPSFLNRYAGIGAWWSPAILFGSFLLVKIVSKIVGALSSSESHRSTVYVLAIPFSLVTEFFVMSYLTPETCTFYFSGLCLYAMMWAWLTDASRFKNDVKIKKTANVQLFVRNMIYAFSLRREKYPKFYHYYRIQDLFCVLSPLIWIKPLAHYAGLSFPGKTIVDCVLIHSVALLLYIALSQFIIFLVNQFTLRGAVNFFGRAKVYLRDTINYSRRIHIRISLGQDNLSELEILKVLSKGVYREYKKVNGLFWGLPFNLSNKLIKVIFIFLVLQIAMKNEGIKTATCYFKEAIGVVNIFPSQGGMSPDAAFETFIAGVEKEKADWDNDGHASLGAGDVVRVFVAYVDYAVAKTYNKVLDHLKLPATRYAWKWVGETRGIRVLPKDDVIALPAVPNYFFILYFVISWVLFSFLSSYAPLGIPSHSRILRRLEDLNDRIDSQLEKELGKEVGGMRTSFKWFARRKKAYPMAGLKEIESELLSILDDIDRIPRIFNRPEFIFILDELDKVGRHDNKTIQDKESEEALKPQNSSADQPFRNHQETVLRLLANLKHFFTTAKAKFLFIAGREMYDASLADISDRNYFMGSIFHDVVYVNSFLTGESEPVEEKTKSEKNHMSYHTSLVEEYVCQFLIPERWNKRRKSLSLKTYKEYLYGMFFCDQARSFLRVIAPVPIAPAHGGNSSRGPSYPVFDEVKYTEMMENTDTAVMLRRVFYVLKLIRYLEYPEKDKRRWYKPAIFWEWYKIKIRLRTLAIFLCMVVVRKRKDVHNYQKSQKGFFSRCIKAMVYGPLLSVMKLKLPVDISLLHQDLKEENDLADNADYILFHTRNFISYLTYRSGGAPKKLAFLLEQYLVSDDPLAGAVDRYRKYDLLAIAGKSTSNFYLHFTYSDLYTFGVINYLTTPFQHAIGRHLRKIDDKLAVSGTYLLDHLYKFHDTGFSWRNIEVTPEIVDVNKSPSLRKLIYDIVQFLTTLHLDSVVSGLFDYRFSQRLTKEIVMLSKLNSRESAALNFTLDESQEVKRHYKRKLLFLNDKHGNVQGPEKGHYIHSVGFIHGSLGDLHYYDQEYDDAILQYKDAVQVLRQNEEMDMGMLVVMIRMMLKLGLTFEKKKSFSSALLTYENLSIMVIRQLAVNLGEEMRILKMRVREDDVARVFVGPSAYNKDTCYFVIQSTRVPTRILLAADDENTLYANLLRLKLEDIRYRNVVKIASASSVRLLYQAFLAKFYLKEKEKIGGIKQDDITIIENEIAFITRVIGPEDKSLILSEYNNKIGDTLFFKNKGRVGEGVDCWSYYVKAIYSVLPGCDPGIPQRDPQYYCQLLGKIMLAVKKNEPRLSSDSWKVLANNLSDLGDAYLTTMTDIRVNAGMLKQEFFDCFDPDPASTPVSVSALDPNPVSEHDLYDVKGIVACSELNVCFGLYLVSARTYLDIHEYKKAAFQYIKMLYIIRQFKPDETNRKNDGKSLVVADLEVIKKNIADKAVEYIYCAYNASTHPEIDRIKRMIKDLDFIPGLAMQHLPAYAEIQKVIALYNMIRVGQLCKGDNAAQEYPLAAVSTFVNGSIPSLYSRLTVLHFKSVYNHHLYAQCREKPQQQDLQKHLIVDSIYCLTSIIRIMATTGISFITNHSMLGYAYYNRGKWCEHALAFEKKHGSSIRDLLREILGSESFDTHSPLYNFEKSFQHYEHSVESHQGKTAYSALIDKMFYLDDDYDDEYSHFHAALERATVLSGNNVSERLVKKIKSLQVRVKGRKDMLEKNIYDSDSYVMVL